MENYFDIMNKILRAIYGGIKGYRIPACPQEFRILTICTLILAPV